MKLGVTKKISLTLVVLMLCGSTQAAVIITTAPEASLNLLSDAPVFTGTYDLFTFAQNTSGTNASLAQTFTIGAKSIVVTSVNLTYENATAADATLTMHIFEVGDPKAGTLSVPGTTLRTETFVTPNVGSTDTLLTITLDSPVVLTANTSYAVYIDCTHASASNNFKWFRSLSDVYAAGAFYDDGVIKTDGERDGSLALYGLIISVNSQVITALKDSLETSTEIINVTASAKNIYIRHRLYENEDASGTPFLENISALLAVGAGAAQTYQTLDTGLSPNLWSPEIPNLYLFKTDILDSGMVVIETRETLVGFRTLEMVGKNFYLNGRPIYLFAWHRTPADRIPSSISDNPAFIAQHINRLKNAHVNFVRLNEGISDSWFEACDRAGIMVMTGPYSGGGTTDTTKWLNNLGRLETEISRLRNHPCVVMWILGNEWILSASGMPATAEQLYDAVKAIDPSRLLFNTWTGKYYGGGDLIAETGSDFLDYHDYGGWYNGSVYDFYNYHTEESYPVTLSECVGAYTHEDTDYTSFQGTPDKQAANLLRTVGHSYSLSADSLFYQAYLTRELSEILRRGRGPASSFCGAMPFTDGYIYPYLQNPNDIAEIAKPVLDEIAKAYEPLHISIRIPYPHRYAGESTPIRFFVMNDDINYYPSLPASTLIVELVAPDDSVAWSTTASTSAVNYYDSWSTQLSVQIPPGAVGGDYTVRGRLMLEQEEIALSEDSLFVAESGWAQINSSAAVAIYDPSGISRTKLQSLGLTSTSISNFNTLTNYAALIIGKDSFDSVVVSSEAVISSFIDSGRRVLILEQNASSARSSVNASSWLGTSLNLSGSGAGEDFVNIERPYLTVLMDGMKRSNFRIWNRNSSSLPQDRTLYDRYYDYSISDMDYLAVLGNGGQHLSHAVLLEIFPAGGTGGSCILSQLRTVGRYNEDPFADKYMANLVGYFLEDSPHYQSVQVDKTIELSRFESEKGLIFAPMKQGLYLNDRQGDGLLFRGEMQIASGLGYLEEKNTADTETGSFYFRTRYDLGRNPIVLDVENTCSVPLNYRIIVNGWTSSWITLSSDQRLKSSFTLPSIIPAGAQVKFSIEANEGTHDWGFSNGLVFYSIQLVDAGICDFIVNGQFDMSDLAVFVSDYWLTGGATGGDVNSNGIVDLKDFALCSEFWKE